MNCNPMTDDGAARAILGDEIRTKSLGIADTYVSIFEHLGILLQPDIDCWSRNLPYFLKERKGQTELMNMAYSVSRQ